MKIFTSFQDYRACEFTSFTLPGIFSSPVRPAQFWNALSLIDVTVEGITSSPVAPLHP